MSPGRHTRRHAEKLDDVRAKSSQQRASRDFKLRRLALKEQRLTGQASAEVQEGPTYQSRIDLEDPHPDLTTIPAPSAPPVYSPIEVPEQRVHVYFDLETTGLCKYIKIKRV